jgi:hypothetical protein
MWQTSRLLGQKVDRSGRVDTHIGSLNWTNAMISRKLAATSLEICSVSLQLQLREQDTRGTHDTA